MKFSCYPVTLCLLLAAALPIRAQTTAAAQAMSFEQARAAFLERSDQLAASAKAVDSARLRREGMQGLGGPSVAITGMGYRYSANVDLDPDPARRALGNGISHLPPQLGGAVGQLPSLPANYDLQRKSNVASASLSAVWPIYMGGLGDAVRGELDAMTDEALADAATSADQLNTLLVQRYFTAQLAERAAALRRRALEGVRAHDDAAQRMLKAGVIAQVERLQASAALADAQQQARKADDDARLARSALLRTVHVASGVGGVRPSSPLFVSSEALPPLQQFLDAAQSHHPGLSKVAAKRRQAESLHDASEALRKPQVLAFGMREVNTSGKPNWVAGVAVRWTLWDSRPAQGGAGRTHRRPGALRHRPAGREELAGRGAVAHPVSVRPGPGGSGARAAALARGRPQGGHQHGAGADRRPAQPGQGADRTRRRRQPVCAGPGRLA